MARGKRGPANTPMASVQQQLDNLSNRVRELETKRVLASQVYVPEEGLDPVEGEHVIDPADDKHAWYSNGAWHKAGGIPWAYGMADYVIEADGSNAEPPFERGGNPTFDTDTDGEFEVSDDNGIRIKKWGTYLLLHGAEAVVFGGAGEPPLSTATDLSQAIKMDHFYVGTRSLYDSIAHIGAVRMVPTNEPHVAGSQRRWAAQYFDWFKIKPPVSLPDPGTHFIDVHVTYNSTMGVEMLITGWVLVLKLGEFGHTDWFGFIEEPWDEE